MKSKKRMSKFLVASLLSYGLSQGCLNNFNVVRGMERGLNDDERRRLEELENFNQRFNPPNDLEQRLTKDGLNGVTNDMRVALDRISHRLMGLPANNPLVQELYDARGRWWGPVCVWDWVRNTNTQYTPIVGRGKEGYDVDGKEDDAMAVNARPLDGARRYCGGCMQLLNSRFVVAKQNGEELLGNMFAHADELAPNGLAQGDVKLPCGHIMCVKCSHRIILTKCCEDESWGHEKGGKLTCPMDRAISVVPNLKTNNIQLGDSYWVSAGKSDLRATNAVYGVADPQTLWASRIRDNFAIPEDEQINDHGRFLRLPQERREQIERERLERERVERERIAEEARLAEKARKAAEEKARLEDEANDFLNVMGDFAEANENERKADEEKRILAEIERGVREKAEAERREEEARIARERRKEEENARLRTTSSPAPTVSTTTNFSAAPSLAAMTALTTFPTLSLSNVATPSISATTPAVQTTTVNATNAPAAPVATNNINNAGTPSGNINAVTPSGVNTPTGNQNVATPNGTTSQVTSSHDMKPGSYGLNNDKINNLDINNTEIPVR